MIDINTNAVPWHEYPASLFHAAGLSAIVNRVVGPNNTEITHGSAMGGFHPPPGPIETRQEIVSIDGAPFACLVAGGCSFHQELFMTPVLTTISSTSANPGDTLTLHGHGFSTSAADNKVTVGGEPCAVTARWHGRWRAPWRHGAGSDTFNFSTSYQVPYCSSNCGIKQAAHPALPPPTY